MMENKREIVRTLIDKDTGEVIPFYPGDRIVRESSLEILPETEDWKIETFFKGNSKEVELVMKDLNMFERAFLFSICSYVSYDTCHLQYSNGVDIGTEELVKIVGMARSIVYSTIDSLAKKDMIYRGKNSRNRQFFVNPWLFCKGNRVNKVLRTMFKNYKIRIYDGATWDSLKKFNY